jgi:hypothetical protein
MPTRRSAGSAKLETAMMTKLMQDQPYRRLIPARIKMLGRGVVTAAAIAALSLTTVPKPAYAGHSNVGAAIGLGILGGVVAGAAIASATAPAYAAPPAYYYGPQQGYYYPPAPAYYGTPQPYYGWAGYGYPQYGYP